MAKEDTPTRFFGGILAAADTGASASFERIPGHDAAPFLACRWQPAMFVRHIVDGLGASSSLRPLAARLLEDGMGDESTRIVSGHIAHARCRCMRFDAIKEATLFAVENLWRSLGVVDDGLWRAVGLRPQV